MCSKLLLLPHTCFRKETPCLLAVGKHSGLTKLFPSEKFPCIVPSQFSSCHPYGSSLWKFCLLDIHRLPPFAVCFLFHQKKKTGTTMAVFAFSEALTKCHRLGGLQPTEIYFSRCWTLESPSSRHRQSPYLVTDHSLRDSTLSLCLTWGYRQKWFSGTSCVRSLYHT